MNACLECLTESLRHSETIDGAERAGLSAGRVRSLIRKGDEAQTSAMETVGPSSVERIRERIDWLMENDDGVWTCCEHDPDFPEKFSRLDDQPKVLYGLGSKSVVSDLRELHPGVALVGARRASAYGREVAERLGRELGAAGVTIVSGMALGVDGAAHRGALSARGRTVAVLAGGVDRPYPPSHRRLYEQIVENGAVVSERPPGSQVRRWGFPARNRLVAALSEVTVFVEGTRKSGALHTVEFARQIGQDPLAIPGPITSPLSDGPNAIIAEASSHAVIDSEGILDRLYSGELRPWSQAVRLDRTNANVGLTTVACEVLEWIRAGENNAAAIQRSAAKLSAREIAIALGELELFGRVKRDGSGVYRATAGEVSGAG